MEKHGIEMQHTTDTPTIAMRSVSFTDSQTDRINFPMPSEDSKAPGDDMPLFLA